MSDFSIEIAGGTLEYIDAEHIYIFDGIIVPSITQIIKTKFGGKYNGVSESALKRAADLGTAVHQAIEDYEVSGIECDLVELRNYKFLKKSYGFECLQNEVPVVLFHGGNPIGAGRLDMVIESEEGRGLADIKRTSKLDKEYLAYQLNLYRLAYKQCYEEEITHLKGLHLRENIRKYVNIPVNQDFIEEFIDGYVKGAEDERN